MAAPQKAKPTRQQGSGVVVLQEYAAASGGELVVRSDLPTPETLDLERVRREADGQDFDRILQLAADTRRQIDRIDAAAACYIGTLLLVARDKCPHGAFLPWLSTQQERLGISQRSAYNYMALAENWSSLGLADKFATVANFGLRDCYTLIAEARQAARKLPGEVAEVSVAPRGTFQEPKKLLKAADMLRTLFSDAEPETPAERSLLKRVEDLVERLEKLASRY